METDGWLGNISDAHGADQTETSDVQVQETLTSHSSGGDKKNKIVGFFFIILEDFSFSDVQNL